MDIRKQLIQMGAACLLLGLSVVGTAQQKPASKPKSTPGKPPAKAQQKDKTAPQKPADPQDKTTPALSSSGLTTTAPTIQELLAKGRDLLKQNKPDEAVKQFKLATTLYPQDASGYESLALVDIQAKRYDEAAQAARTATQLDENGRSDRLAADYSYLADALLGQGKYTAAREASERRIELEPQSIDARMQMGRISMQAKDYPAAERAFLESLGLSPDNPQVHNALGDVYEQENKHAAALGEYDAALVALDTGPLSRSPDAESLRNPLKMARANALAGLKRYREAEQIMREIVSKSPKDASAHSTLAQVLDTAGKHAEAISEYKAALALSPDDAITWGNLGWAQYNAGDFDNALQSSRKALELDNTLSYVRFNLGLIYAVRSQWDQAQKEYKSAIEGAAPADIESGIGDVRDAMAKQPTDTALQNALELLTQAEEKALNSGQ